MSRRVVVLAAVVLLGGCGLFGARDAGPPPAELTEFEAELQLKTLWSADVGKGTDEQFLRLSPVVADGRVHVASRDGIVAAYDAAKGKRIWRTETDAVIGGAVGLAGDLVLVGTVDARVLAFDASDGTKRWESDVSSAVLAPPRGTEQIIVLRTVDGRLQGMSPEDGKRQWVYDQSTPVLTLRGTSAPLVLGDQVFAGFDNGKLVAVRASDGRLLWEVAVGVPRGRSELERMVDIDGDPVARGDVVYAAAFQGRAVAAARDSGEVMWAQEISSHTGLTVDTNAVYLTAAHDHVWALDEGGGASLWKQDKLHDRALTRPAAIGDHVVVGDFEGYLHWLDKDDGHLAARTRVGDEPILAAPVVAGGVLYVYTSEGRLSALRVE